MRLAPLLRRSFVFLLVLPAAALAEQTPQTGQAGVGVLGEGRLETVGKSVYGGVPRPIEDVISGIIQTFLGIIGVVFLGLTIYGGYLWMMARGNEQQVEKAKDTIKAAIIGLAIIVGGYSITDFVVGYIVKAVSPTI